METQDIRNAFYDTLEYLRSSDMQGVLIRTRKNTLLYPDNFCTWHHRPLCKGEVIVVDRTPIETCEKYGKGAKTAVLMAGDPQNPGEPARKGIENSESELCICTSVYPCLTSTEQGDAFYTMNARVSQNTYTDRVLYVREVPVIKSKSGKTIPFDKRVNVDIMVIAVPQGNDGALMNIYKNRIKNAFDVAIEEGVKNIILDAFDTENKEAKVLAKAYAETIQEGHYKDQFEKIIFAIPAYETRMIFSTTLGTQEVIPSITPQVKREPEVVEMPSPSAIKNEYVVKEPEVVPMPTPVQPAPIIKEVKEEPTPEVVEPVKVEEEAPVEPIIEEVKATEPEPVVEEVTAPAVEEVKVEPVVEEAAPVEPEVVRTASEPVVEEPTQVEPIVEEVEAPVVEEAPIEKEPVVVEEPKAAEPVVEEVKVEEPTPVETTPEVETPAVKETVEPEPVVEEAKVAPVVEETAPVEPEVVKTASEPVVEEPAPVETAPTVETPAVEEVVEPVKVEEVTPVEPIVEEVEAPVVEETLVEKEPEPVV